MWLNFFIDVYKLGIIWILGVKHVENVVGVA
jgi:hypothetical protein